MQPNGPVLTSVEKETFLHTHLSSSLCNGTSQLFAISNMHEWREIGQQFLKNKGRSVLKSMEMKLPPQIIGIVPLIFLISDFAFRNHHQQPHCQLLRFTLFRFLCATLVLARSFVTPPQRHGKESRYLLGSLTTHLGTAIQCLFYSFSCAALDMSYCCCGHDADIANVVLVTYQAADIN